ncbi:MAG: M48 family metallopeptidase [Clostridia bacterium]|nr:M48 family metallopeptidase [Clostridia bacterium]
MEYRIIRSRRKTIAIQVKNGEVVVRAPLFTADRTIRKFVDGHAEWIGKALEKSRKLAGERERAIETDGVITHDEIRALAKKAVSVIPERVAHFASILGVTYGRITIRMQRSKWGSCSAKGNLNFNCLLMLAPPEVLDGVVVHELCHRLEMNHSERFYRHVLSVLPDYYERRKWLKNNGDLLMARAFAGEDNA